MLGTLVQGRVSLDGAAVVAQKIGLQIALTYAAERRQFPTVTAPRASCSTTAGTSVG